SFTPFVPVMGHEMQNKLTQNTNAIDCETFQRFVNFDNVLYCILERCALCPQSSNIRGFGGAYKFIQHTSRKKMKQLNVE
ncbi:hypothetical protein Bpfe_001553, partial [Biomphalaria pfeifferi]